MAWDLAKWIEETNSITTKSRMTYSYLVRYTVRVLNDDGIDVGFNTTTTHMRAGDREEIKKTFELLMPASEVLICIPESGTMEVTSTDRREVHEPTPRYRSGST